MKRHMDNVRSSLGDLAGLAAKTEGAERNILVAAVKRLAAVQKELQRLAPGVEGAPQSDQDRYLALTAERGQLDVVISKARSTLGM